MRCRFLRFRLEPAAALLLAAVLCGPPGPARAEPGPHQVGLGLLLGFPQGELADEVDETGVGVGGYYTYTFGRSGIGVGLDLGFLTLGSETRQEPFSTTIPDVTVDVTNSNQMFLGHLLLRYAPSLGRVQPHLDGLFGLKYL